MTIKPGRRNDGAKDRPALAGFWDMPEAERARTVLSAILDRHALHYRLNNAYRSTVAARGVGPLADLADLPRLLRATSQTFKSYIDALGTPFPQEDARGFVAWLADQLSVELPRERFDRLRPQYRSLERLLRAVESLFSDLGLEMLTSSGTSGRATVIARDALSTDLTVESFYLAFQRYFGMKADHRAVFMMPRRTRIAMARMARFSVERVGLTPDRVHFAIPFPAYPDQVRIRAGRTFRPGWHGAVERRLWHPAMRFLQERYVDPQAVEKAMAALIPAVAHGERVLLFGSLTHLHALASFLLAAGRQMTLAPGSLLGTGGGMKEIYPAGPEEIRHDLGRAFVLSSGDPVPIRDVYGMAEANWAAMQCSHGNYHVPPWVHAVTVDDDGDLQSGDRTTGLLAFYDPFGGGDLFPAFFRSADRVTLATGGGSTACPCGDRGAYLEQASIQRVDLMGEAGCAAQV
jgi:hypothetical protein